MTVKCQHLKSRVSNTRSGPHGIRRTRTCFGCGHRWYTLEVKVSMGGMPTTVHVENALIKAKDNLNEALTMVRRIL